MRDKILRCLEKNQSSGNRLSEIVIDWLSMTEATLEAMPRHVEAVKRGGKFAVDTPAVQKLWAELRDKYRNPEHFKRFAEAFQMLLETSDTFQDTVGPVFMEACANAHAGQFFTPYCLAKLSAEMICKGAEEQVHERIKAAIEGEPLAEALMVAGLALENSECLQWFITKIVPLVHSKIEPVKIMDPACGSGCMLLAAASTFPRWMLDLGLVQFYGQDIDLNCVRMTRINMMLYGLNGYALKLNVALQTEPQMGQLDLIAC